MQDPRTGVKRPEQRTHQLPTPFQSQFTRSMKTPIAVLLLLSAVLPLSQSSQAQATSTEDAAVRDADGVATLAPGQTSAALSFDRELSRIIRVPLFINGQGPFLFALDSGAGAIVLDEGLARKLGLQPVGEHGTAMGIGSAKVDGWRTNATLQIGDATLTHQPLMAMDFSSVKAVMGQDVCGSLGKEFFEHFVVRIDPAQRTVTLRLPTADGPGSNGVVLPLSRNKNGLPCVQGKIGGVDGTFVVDTACSAAVALNAPFVEKHQLREKFGTVGPNGLHAGAVGLGGAISIQLCPPTLLEMGSMSAKYPVVLLPGTQGGDSADGIIGTPVLFHAPVTFDFPHKQIVLEAK